MHDRAFPEGAPRVTRLKIHAQLFDEARRLFDEQRFEESLAVIRDALQRPVEAAGSIAAPALREGAVLLAWNLHQLRRYDECRQWLRQAAAEDILPADDPEAVVVELWIKWSEGCHREVVSRADGYVQQFSGRLHPLLGEFLFIRGNARNHLGDYKLAEDDCASAYQFFKVLANRERQAEACNVIGASLLQQSRYTEALRWLHESLELNAELKLTRRMGSNYINIGIANYKQGHYAEAQRYLTLAVQTHQQLQSPNSVCRAKIALGNVCRLLRDFTGARSNLMAAYTLATEQKLPREECLALEFLGDVFRDEGKPREARRYYSRGLAIANKIAPAGDLMAELLRREGECLVLLDQLDEALPVLRRARKLAVRLGDRFEEGIVLRCLGEVASAAGDWKAAREHLAKAQACLEGIEARHELASTHLQTARMLRAQADAGNLPATASTTLEEALKHALVAHQTFQELNIAHWLAEADEVVSSLAWRHLGMGDGDDLGGSHGGPNGERAQVLANLRARQAAASEVVAVSTQMRAVLQQSDAYAAFEETVLITGETGTGKDLLARRIHDLSARRDKPFVAVNCAAIPATLFEREFFGHRKGAYSSADADCPGFVASAEGGTLFLDEVGELPAELQPKLLRLLQDGTYTRLGDPTERRADIRLLAATNSDLDQLVAAGRFRQDLNYRLKILELSLAPLRERTDDILPLLNHFLSKFTGHATTAWAYFGEASIRALQSYAWLGNVREIIMVARRAHISRETMGRTEVQLGNGSGGLSLTGPANAEMDGGVTRERIVKLLDQNGGNKAETARSLGVSRQTLYRWLKRHGIAT